jgi:hypothetical protein
VHHADMRRLRQIRRRAGGEPEVTTH